MSESQAIVTPGASAPAEADGLTSRAQDIRARTLEFMDAPAEADGLTSRAQDVRARTLEFMERLRDAGAACELPPPPDEYRLLAERLKHDDYTVLVLGEAKRGKSTLINALIGAELLPTDVAEATAQVFCIRDAPAEAYRLRFEDDSVREIGREDLDRYGSQEGIVTRGGALGESLRWIEVDRPVRFLPPGVRLLDTPGLGARFAAHAEITQRFVPRADAVIFVLECQPMVEEDTRFLEAVLAHTPNVFFVQTKIDTVGRDAWQEQNRRNQQVLRERFGGRLRDTRIWPISALNLLKAAAAEGKTSDVLLAASRQQTMAAALRTFLYRVAGWARPAAAIVAAGAYHRAGRATLSGRQTTLREGARDKVLALQRDLAARRKQFEDQWGPAGARRAGFNKELSATMARAREHMRHVLPPGGPIQRCIQDKIDRADSHQRLQALLPEIPRRVTEAAVAEWQKACNAVEAASRAMADAFQADLEGMTSYAGQLEPVEGNPGLVQLEEGLFRRLRGAVMGTTIGTTIASVPAGVLGAVALAATAPVVVVAAAVSALAVAVAGPIWGFFSGWGEEKRRQIQADRQQLNRLLADTLGEARDRFLGADIAAGRGSFVEEQLQGLAARVNEAIERSLSRKADEFRAEQQRLEKQAELDRAEWQAALAQATARLTRWEALRKPIDELAAELHRLDAQLEP